VGLHQFVAPARSGPLSRLRAARASLGHSDRRFRDLPSLPASLATVSHSRVSADWGACTRRTLDWMERGADAGRA